jgi:hypothetical protein
MVKFQHNLPPVWSKKGEKTQGSSMGSKKGGQKPLTKQANKRRASRLHGAVRKMQKGEKKHDPLIPALSAALSSFKKAA